MTLPRIMAFEIWNNLDPECRINALQNEYAAETHPAHNVHVLAQEIVAYRAEELAPDINVAEALCYCRACEELAGLIPPQLTN